jgi:fatty acid desaturase
VDFEVSGYLKDFCAFGILGFWVLEGFWGFVDLVMLGTWRILVILGIQGTWGF